MTNQMTPSENCVALTKEFEGCQLTAYSDPAGVWTVGYGHTGSDVRQGVTITQHQADDFLMADLKEAGRFVNIYVKVQINQNQFDALTDFVYNLGVGSFKSSTLLLLINNGDFDKAALEFGKWNKAGAVEVPGLTRRRAAEAALFTKV
jgi:lysozyme